VCIVSARFAEMYLPHMDPLGQRLELSDESTPAASPTSLTIVAVAPSIRQSMGGTLDPVVYLPLRSQPQALAAIIVRQQPGIAVLPALREEVRAIDDELPLYNVLTLDRLSEMSRWPQRSTSFVLSMLGVVALLLAAAGLYGVTAHSVLERIREIGVRMAVGARASQVMWLILGRAVGPLAIGLCFGVAGGIAVRRLVGGLLVVSNDSDAAVLAGVALILVSVAMTACLVPARRAARLDPITVLREE
jgi:ABC-type antimicrobial peptide transport system permease subunit